MKITIAEKSKMLNFIKDWQLMSWDKENKELIGKIKNIVFFTEVGDHPEYEFILKIELLAGQAGEPSEDEIIKTIEEPFSSLLEAKEVAESDHECELFWSNLNDEGINPGNKLFTGNLGTVQYTIEKRIKGEFSAEIAQKSSKYIKEDFKKYGRVVR